MHTVWVYVIAYHQSCSIPSSSCPTECRLSYSTHPWRCSVSIRRITGPDGVPLGEAKSERFGPIITDKAQVEDRIRRAQRAILNPRTSSQTFLEGDDEDPQERQLTFSRNCVCLEISGPDIADLSFVDLPGMCFTRNNVALYSCIA
jgi:hypothetical protein